MYRNHSLKEAFHNAYQGFRYVLTTQRNAKIHTVITVIVVVLGFFFHISSVEWTVILLAIGLVWTSECLNTGLEKITDLVSPEYNGLAKVTKDTAAAGVLLASLTAAIIGVIIFLPKVLVLLHL